MIDLADAIEGLDPSHIGCSASLLAQACASLDRLQAVVVDAIGSFDAQGLWAIDNSVNMTGWLKSFAHVSASTGANWTAMAKRLRDLPLTAAAVRDGRLSCDQARAITRRVSARHAEAFRADEDVLLPLFEPLTVADIDKAMGEWNARISAALDDGPPPDASRRLDLSPVGDEWVLDATLTAEGGQLVSDAIREAMSPDAEGELRTVKQQRADALVDLCRWFLTHHDAPPKTERRPHLDLVASVTDLRDGGAGRTTDGMVIDPVTLERLTCDAVVSPFLVSGRAHVVYYGRSKRTASKAQRRALKTRDRHCRWPGCDRTPDWCDAHHLRHWAKGGSTDMDNLVLFCCRHHHVLHQPGWTLKLDPHDATLHITTPDGRTLISRPPPLDRPTRLFDTA